MDKSSQEKLNIKKIHNGIKFQIKLIPNSSRCEILGISEGILKIKIDAPPIEGRANEKIIKFLSEILRIPKSKISIISGEKSKTKLIFVEGNPEEIEEKIKNIL
jgi:hypothetical protein